MVLFLLCLGVSGCRFFEPKSLAEKAFWRGIQVSSLPGKGICFAEWPKEGSEFCFEIASVTVTTDALTLTPDGEARWEKGGFGAYHFDLMRFQKTYEDGTKENYPEWEAEFTLLKERVDLHLSSPGSFPLFERIKVRRTM